MHRMKSTTQNKQGIFCVIGTHSSLNSMLSALCHHTCKLPLLLITEYYLLMSILVVNPPADFDNWGTPTFSGNVHHRKLPDESSEYTG
jgi:hypothetical protein